jgi:hypothetical protein
MVASVRREGPCGVRRADKCKWLGEVGSNSSYIHNAVGEI